MFGDLTADVKNRFPWARTWRRGRSGVFLIQQRVGMRDERLDRFQATFKPLNCNVTVAHRFWRKLLGTSKEIKLLAARELAFPGLLNP